MSTSMSELSVGEHVTIESLILANHVEAVNGLLYMSGGGWTEHHRAVPPNSQGPTSHFGVAIGIRVPWNETNRPHPFMLRIENEDSTDVIATVQTQINVGRPPQLTEGAGQPVMIGINVDTVFPRAGGYRILVQLGENGPSRIWPFRVRDVQMPSGLTQLG